MGRSISGQILRVRRVVLSGWPWRYRGPCPLPHLMSACLLLIIWPFRPRPLLSPSCWQAGYIGFFSPGGGPNTLLWVPHCALWVLGCHESGKTWRYEWLTWRNNQCLTSIMGWPWHQKVILVTLQFPSQNWLPSSSQSVLHILPTILLHKHRSPSAAKH